MAQRKKSTASRKRNAPPSSGAQPLLAHNFQSEATLRQAIFYLLRRVPGVSGLQLLHGKLELGKDLVFSTPGPFAEPVRYACVVKNTPITGSASKQSGAREVFNQIEQALDTPYIDLHDGPVRVDQVYVICPHPVSQETALSIWGKLRDARRVRFISGHELYDMFRRHWPDYLADEAAALASHRRSIEEATDSSRAHKQIAFTYHLEDASESAPRVYVTPSFFRAISRYSLRVALESYLPSNEELEAEYHLREVNLLCSRVVSLSTILSHFREWDFLLESKDAQRDVIKQLDLLRKLMLDCFVERARIKIGVHRLELSQISPEMIASLTPGESERRSTRLAGKRPAIPLFDAVEGARKAVRSATKPVYRALTAIDKLCSRNIGDGVKALLAPEVVAAMVADDCFETAPDGTFARYSGVTINLPRDLVQQVAHPLLIVGAPGMGKTTFCRSSALGDAERYTVNSHHILPTIVPLHRLGHDAIASFESAFLSSVGKSVLAHSVTKPDHPDVVIRLYLDGLDEVADTEQRKKLIRTARSGSASGQECRVVMTARDYLYDPELQWMVRVSIAPMDADQQKSLVEQWLKDTELVKSFFLQLSGVPAIRTLMGVPLLATVTILVFRKTGRVPENRARLYSAFTELLSGGWDLAKGVLRESRFGTSVKIMVLARLAVTLHKKRSRDCDRRTVLHAGRYVVSKRSETQLPVLLAEMLADGLLVRAGDRFYFAHLSFQEYLAAKFMLGDPDSAEARQALRAYLSGDDWWREVLAFYVGLSENPVSVADWLERHRGDSGLDRMLRVRSLLEETFPDFDTETLFKIRSGVIHRSAETQRTL